LTQESQKWTASAFRRWTCNSQSRESAPDRRKRCTSNALATALRHDVELGDLPGATSGFRGANQGKTNDDPLAANHEWMATRFREIFVEVRIFGRVGHTDGSLSVAGQLAEIVVEQAGDGFAILQSCVTQIHN
jgi:hypothetical protein